MGRLALNSNAIAILSMPVLTEKVPLSYTFHWQWYPFGLPSLNLCIATLSMAFHVMSFKYEYITKSEPFNSQKMHLLAFWASSPKWQISLPFHILLTSTIPTLLKPEKGTSFRRSLQFPHRLYMKYKPGSHNHKYQNFSAGLSLRFQVAG